MSIPTFARTLVLLAPLLMVGSCGDADLVEGGDEVTIRAPDGTTFGGIAVNVRMRNGSTAPAIFRGPPALARVASGGDYTFAQDSLPSRVRLLEPGEEMVKR